MSPRHPVARPRNRPLLPRRSSRSTALSIPTWRSIISTCGTEACRSTAARVLTRRWSRSPDRRRRVSSARRGRRSKRSSTASTPVDLPVRDPDVERRCAVGAQAPHRHHHSARDVLRLRPEFGLLAAGHRPPAWSSIPAASFSQGRRSLLALIFIPPSSAIGSRFIGITDVEEILLSTDGAHAGPRRRPAKAHQRARQTAATFDRERSSGVA